MKTAFRLKQHIRHNPYLRKTHDETLSKVTSIRSILGAPCDRLSKTEYIFDRSFHVVITNDLNECCREAQWADASFCTDASLGNTGEGCGICCANIGLSRSIPMGKMTTIKQLEIAAVNECGRQRYNRQNSYFHGHPWRYEGAKRLYRQ